MRRATSTRRSISRGRTTTPRGQKFSLGSRARGRPYGGRDVTTMWAWSALLRRPTPSSKSLIHKNFFLASGAPSPINGSREVLDLGGEIRRHPQRGNTPLGGTHMRHPERARARVRSLSGLSLSFAALLT